MEKAAREALPTAEFEWFVTYLMAIDDLPAYPAARRQLVATAEAGYAWAEQVDLVGIFGQEGEKVLGRAAAMWRGGPHDNSQQRGELIAATVIELRSTKLVFNQDNSSAPNADEAFAAWRAAGNDWPLS